MSDGSIASQVEDWIVTQIRGITVGTDPPVLLFADEEVRPWEGTNKPTAKEVGDEFQHRGRNKMVRVMFTGDSTRPLEDGEVEVVPIFAVIVGVKIEREAASRRGESASEPGTNLMRDLIRYALHDQEPALDDGTTWVERAEWRGSSVMMAGTGFYLMQSLLAVHEVPKGA